MEGADPGQCEECNGYVGVRALCRDCDESESLRTENARLRGIEKAAKGAVVKLNKLIDLNTKGKSLPLMLNPILVIEDRLRAELEKGKG